MKIAAVVAVTLLAAVLVGGAVWAVADGDERRAGALDERGAGLTSPNGEYSLAVRDDGIYLNGPAGSVALSKAGVVVDVAKGNVSVKTGAMTIEVPDDLSIKAGRNLTLEAGATAILKAAATATVQASGATSVKGSVVQLNCASGGRPVARQNDLVNVPAAPGTFPILQGAPTVLAC
jgi:hypothetical protein